MHETMLRADVSSRCKRSSLIPCIHLFITVSIKINDNMNNFLKGGGGGIPVHPPTLYATLTVSLIVKCLLLYFVFQLCSRENDNTLFTILCVFIEKNQV